MILPPKKKKKEQTAQQVHRRRKAREKLSPWAELVGVKLSLPDDPILLDFKGDANEKRPLRLILRVQ